MQKRFLKPLCERRARIIFESVVEEMGCPTNPEDVSELRERCYKRLYGYNPVEVELMKEKIDEMVAEYKSKLLDYVMIYQ